MRRKMILWIIGTIILVIAILICVGVFYGSRHYVVHEYTFNFNDLPEEFDGYRIAHISDFHLTTFSMTDRQKDVAKIVDVVNSQHCDAVCFTGDLVSRTAKEVYGYENELSRIDAPDGVFAVMGNHDYAQYTRSFSVSQRKADIQELQRKERSFGWNLLLNEHRILRRGNDSIVIAGVENDGNPKFFPSLGDLPKTLKGVDKGAFTVLLSHDPTYWERKILSETEVQLTLSGHTHGGQFKVFGWSPVALLYDEWGGTYQEGGRILFVSEGVGCHLPFRLGSWPEIDVITLRKNKKN